MGEAPVTFLRMQGLQGRSIILVAAKHNHREILAELGGIQSGIDPTKTALNRVLRGESTAAGVAGEAQHLMSAAGVKKLRKDALRGVEVVFSLPPSSSIDADAFFEDAVQWAEQWFSVPILSAVVHNDEAAPHCHVILLPLVDGGMRGSALMGNRSKLLGMQADFHAKVGKNYGLFRQSSPLFLSHAVRAQAIDAAFDMLEANSGLHSTVLRALLTPHLKNPAPLLEALGIAIPTVSAKAKSKDSFVAIMTRPCKVDRKKVGRINPIEEKQTAYVGNDQVLSCVGVGDLANADSTALKYGPSTVGIADVKAGSTARTVQSTHAQAQVRNHECLAQDSPVSIVVSAIRKACRKALHKTSTLQPVLEENASEPLPATLNTCSVHRKPACLKAEGRLRDCYLCRSRAGKGSEGDVRISVSHRHRRGSSRSAAHRGPPGSPGRRSMARGGRTECDISGPSRLLRRLQQTD